MIFFCLFCHIFYFLIRAHCSCIPALCLTWSKGTTELCVPAFFPTRIHTWEDLQQCFRDGGLEYLQNIKYIWKTFGEMPLAGCLYIRDCRAFNMQTCVVNLQGKDMRISHIYLTIGHIFQVIRITRTVFIMWKCVACNAIGKFQLYFSGGIDWYILILCLLQKLKLDTSLSFPVLWNICIFTLSLHMILLRLVFFIDFIQELAHDNHKFSLSFLSQWLLFFICIISFCIILYPIRKIETITVMWTEEMYHMELIR